MDECEAPLGHLEKRVAAPDATVEALSELVSALPSSTVSAPRQLTAGLRSRLEGIASHHGGRVPLHGRLFAQFMHHAYPRECPYPHVSGTTKPMTDVQWVEATGEEPVASEEEMRQHAERAPSQPIRNEDLPWSAEEELFCVRPVPQEAAARHPAWAVGRNVALVLALVSFAVGALRTSSAAASATSSQKPVKLLV